MISDEELKELVQSLWDENFMLDRENDVSAIFTENDLKKAGIDREYYDRAMIILEEIKAK